MKIEKPEWMKLKELHDAELIEFGEARPGNETRPRSRGAVYGPTESNVDQVGDQLVDVNQLMARFEKMPTAQQLAAAGLTSGGFYDNFIGAPDFEESLQTANRAKAAFALLPAGIRERFQNNPGELLTWMADPANSDECIRLGFKNPPKPKGEPEITLKDVRDAIQGTAKAKKTAPKGGEANEE